MSERPASELALLGVFLAVAVGFAALTTTFRSSSAQTFPRLTAAVVVIGVALLLVEAYLPEPLRRVVTESNDLVDREEFEDYEPDAEADAPVEGGGGTDEAEADRALSALTDRQFTFAAIAGYAALAYVASVLVATPLFVVAYGYRHRQPAWAVAVLVALSVGICLALMTLANAPLDRSMLFPRGVLGGL